jgi:hypothetical protein
VDADGVGEATPSLKLLGDLLGVGWSEYASDASVFERVRQGVQKLRHGIKQTNGREDARAKEGISAESVEECVFGAGNVRVYPLDVRQLFYGEFADRSFFALSNPL